MPTRTDAKDDPRRDFLLKALASGMFAVGAFAGAVRGARAQVLGRRPGPLPAGRSIYSLRGEVRVNGQPADGATRIGASDTIRTGKDAELVFAVGADAFILRENSELAFSGTELLVRSLRLATGALLSVFGRGPKQVFGATATIGIRGTGLYLESEPEQTYICTCYGEVEIAAADDPSISERIVSKHHDAPRYVLKPGAAKRIRPAPFKNHTDLELTLIESLVGRTPPFSLFDESYGSPRRY
ncbi:MAG TPA: iron dicitrate transport regulator FecR [Burkholderiales bacterium]|nr:iron dicitrate transport regulator FecR [Burkholderiales bacterium]